MNEQKKRITKSKKKMGSLSEVLGREKSRRIEVPAGGKVKFDCRKPGRHGIVEDVEESSRKQERSGVTEEAEEELTLAEMKVKALKKKLKGKNENRNKFKIREERLVVDEKEKRQLMLIEDRDMEVMAVEDSDFYDFDEDRVERSFKKGQIWAIYDDDDGMPRHYGLIEEVVSLNPFEVRMNWLDLQNDEDERLTALTRREKVGFHVSCGTFEVARKDTTNLLNIFSHVVECERAARKLYRIYPHKGSIWALYNERASDVGGGDSLTRDQRSYDIAVFLTSYSEMHGLSMAYLEKVCGFRAVFKRREIGCHAISWLDKDDFRLFSHQIPAKKLSGKEAPHLSGECWELDPASLPPYLLTVSRKK